MDNVGITPPQIPSAPPVTPTGMPERPPAGWPKVFGIIGIVLGGSGIMAQSCGTIMAMIPEIFSDLPGQTPETLAAAKAYLPLTLLLGTLAVALSVLLLVGSIRLLHRRASSVKLLRMYAIARAIHVPVAAGVAFLAQSEQFEAMKNNPGAVPAASVAMMEWMPAFTMVYLLVWGWLWPALLLWWLNRPRSRQDIASFTQS